MEGGKDSRRGLITSRHGIVASQDTLVTATFDVGDLKTSILQASKLVELNFHNAQDSESALLSQSLGSHMAN